MKIKSSIMALGKGQPAWGSGVLGLGALKTPRVGSRV